MENTVSEAANLSIHINNRMERLLLKTHNITRLKYLCYSSKEKFEEYLGSGKHWRRHLKKYGNDISTEVLFETENKDELIEKAKYFSDLFDIVNSKEFANLVPEQGTGGATTQIYRWINNGKTNKYILKTEEIPNGFKAGRICKFSDPEFQSKMSIRAHSNKKNWTDEHWKEIGEKISKAKKGKPVINLQGDKNPAKNPITRKKMQESQRRHFSLTSKIKCEYCNKEIHKSIYTRCHGEKCKMK